jgi:hypothetical protein
MQHERSTVHWLSSVHHVTVMIYQDQVAGFHVAETFAEWVHPKTVGEFWVTRSDVPGNAFSVTKATKHAQRSSETNFSRSAFVFN